MTEPFELLRDELWRIKNRDGGQTFSQMASQARLPESTLFRVMKGQRQPAPTTLRALLLTWPDLMRVFLADDVPDGTDDLHEHENVETA
jgi:predicted transcriptional regulator